MPERLVEYTADVQSPDGYTIVGNAYVSRFGFQVKWHNVTSSTKTLSEPDLDAAIGQLIEQLSRTGNKLVNGRYTENAGVTFTDKELNEYTSFVPGESEQKTWMKRYHDLMSAVSGMDWFRYRTLRDGVRLSDIDGIGDGNENLLFYCAYPVYIMVPSSLKFPYNVKLRERCKVAVDKYVSIDEAKKDGESDLDCIDRIAKKIAEEYKEKSVYVDGLIAEADGKAEKYSNLIKTYAELCMKAITSRLSIAQYSILLHDICVAYRKLVPGEPIDGLKTLHLYRSMVDTFVLPTEKGTMVGNKVTFKVDLSNLVDNFKDMMLLHGFPTECQSVLDCIDKDTAEISLVLTWGTGNTIFKIVGVSDPAKSPYVE
jgi:hypothetical protein